MRLPRGGLVDAVHAKLGAALTRDNFDPLALFADLLVEGGVGEVHELVGAGVGVRVLRGCGPEYSTRTSS